MIDAGAGIEAGGVRRSRLGPWIGLGLCGAIVIGVGAGAGLHRLQGDHGLLAAQPPATGLHGEATWAAGSVNPRDTAASTRAAVRKWGLAAVAPWRWLRGGRAELARVWRDYHIFVAPPRDGDISHTEALYVIDRRGAERSGYLYPFIPRFVTLDLRTLATERGT